MEKGVKVVLVVVLLVGIFIVSYSILKNVGYAVSSSLTSCGVLDQAGVTYVLQNDVSSEGTCFSIISDNITLDLNNHAVTYDNSLPINVPDGDFESGGAITDKWNFTNASNMQNAAGTFVQPVSVYSGSYAVKISVPAPDQYIRSKQPITLQAGIPYSLSFMTFSSIGWNGTNNFIRYVELEGTGIRAKRIGVNDRGFQYNYINFTPTSTITAYLKIGISGAQSIETAYPQTLYFDDIRIQRYQPVGVVIGPQGLGSIATKYIAYDVNRYGSGNNAIVKNGVIIQGTEGGQGAHGILIARASNVEIAKLDITVYGANSKNILSENSNYLKIHDNTLTDNVKTIVNRMNYDGAVIYAESAGHGGLFYNNIITTGPQNGIVVNSDGTNPPHQIYSNTISLNSMYTNDFAIAGWNDKGNLIHDNIINCGSGDRSCRGIYIGGSNGLTTKNTKVYNNIISVQELKRNQEYNGCSMGGAYGIQVEPASNIEIYNNTVTANADQCEAHAFRTNPDSNSSMYAHDNVFTAVRIGLNMPASSLKISSINNNTILRFENNTLVTNNRWLYGEDGASLFELKSNTFKTEGTLSSPFKPLATYNYADKPTCSRFIKDIKFIDNKYPDILTEGSFESASIVNKNPFLCTVSSTNDADKNSSFFYAWTLIVNVKDQSNNLIQNAAVTITDTFGNQSFSGVTNANGQVVAILNEFKNAASVKTIYNPYLVTVTYNTVSSSHLVTVDSAKTSTFPEGSPPYYENTPSSGGSPGGGGGGGGGGGSGCTDGTPLNTCLATKPTYCNSNAQLVDSCSNCGCLSGYSCDTSTNKCVQSIPQPSTLSPPSNLIGKEVAPGKIDLTWTDNSNDETGFIIESTTNTRRTPWTELARVGANVDRYSHTGVTALSINYRVKAYNSEGNSSYSNQIKVTTHSCKWWKRLFFIC